MLILLSMAFGIIIGLKLFPAKWTKINSNLQVGATAVLIFSMGVSLGSRENFLSELKTLGLESLLYAIIPIITSILFVYFLTEKFMKRRKEK